jgi:hypothetical protein
MFYLKPKQSLGYQQHSFRLLLLCTTGIFYQFNHSNIYTNTSYNIQLYMAHSPCFYLPLPISPFSPLYPFLLTWNPPSCDRNRPPRSQVACKLTLPCPNLHPNPPPSKFPEPQLPSASLRRPQEYSGSFCPEQDRWIDIESYELNSLYKQEIYREKQ